MYGTSTQMMPRIEPREGEGGARHQIAPAPDAVVPLGQLDLSSRERRRTGAAGFRPGRGARAASSPRRRSPARAAAFPSAAARPRHPAAAPPRPAATTPGSQGAAARIARAGNALPLPGGTSLEPWRLSSMHPGVRSGPAPAEERQDQEPSGRGACLRAALGRNRGRRTVPEPERNEDSSAVHASLRVPSYPSAQIITPARSRDRANRYLSASDSPFLDPALAGLRARREPVPGRLRGRVPDPAMSGELRESRFEEDGAARASGRRAGAGGRRRPFVAVVRHAHGESTPQALAPGSRRPRPGRWPAARRPRRSGPCSSASCTPSAAAGPSRRRAPGRHSRNTRS